MVLGQKKYENTGQQKNPRAKEIFPHAILGRRAIGSPTLPSPIPDESNPRFSNSLFILFSRILLHLYVAHSFQIHNIENPM